MGFVSCDATTNPSRSRCIMFQGSWYDKFQICKTNRPHKSHAPNEAIDATQTCHQKVLEKRLLNSLGTGALEKKNR